MKKAQKKQANDFVNLLDKAHEEIRKAIAKKNYSMAAKILEQCQTGAFELGTMIERTEGEGFVTVPLLEQYCEKVYQVYEEVAQGSEPDGDRIYKSLRKSLIPIGNSIKNDIRPRIEAVFLPYKVSMWDSLESVWEAAAEDPLCDTYVIPIPYYERNPAGNLCEMHYEGDLYPAYVPVTKYDQFDWEGHHPDIVFVHNTYDEYNYVTSVHPFFYSGNLKKYTDCLVYIPYYEIGGEQAESFHTLPSYFAMDWIVAQSKEHKRQFDARIQDKILTLGSPKFDRVIRRQLDVEDIPKEWRSKLRGKVFFYNTSISGLLKDGIQAIEKMRYVFKSFENIKATLIWRPHPLTESTIRSMRPGLVDAYEEAVEYFSHIPYGILDKTQEAGTAIGLADAYIGEETSSIVHLFGVLGKPILIANAQITEDFTEEAGIPKFFDCIEEEGGAVLWAPLGDRNGLMQYDRRSRVLKFYEIPGEKPDGHRLYNAILPYEGQLYLIPYNAREIAVFDKRTETFFKLPFDEPVASGFTKAYAYGKKIYMVPARYPAILELECETGRIAYMKLEHLKGLQYNKEAPFSFNASMQIGSILLIALTCAARILELDLSDKKARIVDLAGGRGRDAEGFWCMAGDAEHIILGSAGRRRLLYWNRISNESRVLDSYPDGWQGNDKCFFEMQRLDKAVYVFPKEGNKLLRISLGSLQIEAMDSAIQDPQDMAARKSDYYDWASNTFFAKKQKDCILFQRAYDRSIRKIKEGKAAVYETVVLPEEVQLSGMRLQFYRRGKNLPWVMRETKLYTLSRFVEYVQKNMHDGERQKKEYAVIAENLDGTAGEKIYRRIAENEANGSRA